MIVPRIGTPMNIAPMTPAMYSCVCVFLSSLCVSAYVYVGVGDGDGVDVTVASGKGDHACGGDVVRAGTIGSVYGSVGAGSH